MSKHLRFMVFLFVAICTGLGTAIAQDSGIQGVVTDQSLAVIPGADVTATYLATGIDRAAISNEAGFYSFPLLKEGHYRIKVTMSGFSSQETKTQVRVGQVVRLDFQLQLGQVSEVVEVTSVGEALQSKPMDVGQVIDERRISELPLNGRNYLELAQLSAGVVRVTQAGSGHRAGEEGSFQAAGMHIAQNNILLDGVDNTSRASGGPFHAPVGYEAQAVKPSVDAISEFKVITNNVSAEHGYRMGAKVLVSTKSGTNNFHGSLFEFHRNSAVSANPFFFNRNVRPGETGQKQPQYIRNQFGGTFGGPIIGDKTFFFVSYQGTLVRKAQSATSTVPSQEVRNGNFSLQPAIQQNIFDPLTLMGTGATAVRQPFPNNTIPQGRMDPVAQKLIEFYPLPNIAGRENLQNNYFAAPSIADDAHQYDFRVDHNFNDTNRVFFRFSLRNQDTLSPSRLPPPAFGGNGQSTIIDAKNLAANYSLTISPKVHNEFRFGWTGFPASWTNEVEEGLTNNSLGIKGAPGGDDPGYAGMTMSGFTALGPPRVLPSVNDLQIYHVSDNVLWQMGKHSLKFGGEFRRTSVLRTPNGERRGLISFDGRYTTELPNDPGSRSNTGNSMADFLLGWAWRDLVGTPLGENVFAPSYGFYVQDDWRITPRFTLNLGLRWELYDGPYYPDPQNQPQVSRPIFTGEIHDEFAPILPIEFHGFVFPKDGRDCHCDRDMNNFAPRVGLAYRLGNDTVIRAGGGFYYGQNDDIAFESGRFQEGPPNAIIQRNIQHPLETTNFFLSEGFSPLVFPGPDTITPAQGIVRFVPESLPTMYTGQWFLDVQHHLPWNVLLTTGYNGSATSHLSWWRIVNAPATPHPTIPWPRRARFPDIFAINEVSNILNANYNAFSFRAEKRFSEGLTFLSSFTWSKIIDYGREVQINNETANAVNTASALIKDLFRNRARADLDRTLNYNLSFLYELPWGSGKRWLQSGPASWVLGGWQVGGILSMLSGTPLDHDNRPDFLNCLCRRRGNLVGDPNLPSSQRSIDRWFNTDAFTNNVPGQHGNAGRNLIDQPGWKNFDFSASKAFPMPMEGHALHFRFESFNLTNTPHFGQPAHFFGRPGTATITTASDPRLIQFGLRYVF